MRRWLSIANEGWPIIIVLAIVPVALWYSPWPLFAFPAVMPVLLAVVKFHDPEFDVDADPNGVLSPVSGKVSAIARHGDEWRILIRVGAFGPYFLRSPVAGDVRDAEREHAGHGISLHTGEGANIYLRLYGGRLFPPRSWLEIGSRIGQGQRFGVLRMAAGAELALPETAKLAVAEGDRVKAGRTLLAELATGSN